MMDYNEYKETYFTDPPPEPRYGFEGSFMATLYYEEFDPALKFYETVLGPAGYAEGDNTRGWQVGRGWLTILRGKKGNPQNMELMFELKEVEEVEALYKAFVEAGARGVAPSDQLMYNPVSYCLVTDPFGVDLVIFSRLDKDIK